MSATSLAVGDLAIIGVNTQDTVPGGTSTNDLISFMLLAPIGSGTVIYFTDRSWNGSTFSASGGADAGDGTYTYTAGADLPAGTVITITAAQLSGAGMLLDEDGDAIYVYQGTNANTPTTFLHAVELADGNTTFNGSLTNTGLVSGTSALALAVNNAEFGTHTSDINKADLFAQINNNTDWVQNDNSPQDGSATGTPAYTAPDAQLWVAGSGAGEAIVTINLDSTYSAGTLGYQIVQAFQNDANLFHPSDITLDTVHGKFFFVDSDISGGHNRIVEGSISQLLNNPGAALTFNILYADDSATAPIAGHGMRTLSIDTTNGIIYFDHATTFDKITYSLTGTSTSNQTATQLANLGTNNYITQATIDYVHGEVYLGSSRITTGFSGDTISKNYVYVATGLTSGSSTLTFSQLPFTPDDAGLGPEGSPLSGEAWPVERGNIRGIDVDPINHDLYIVTGAVTLDNDGNGATTYPGGIWKYDLDSNPTGVVTNLFTQNFSTGPVGLMYYIEVDPATGKYYVIDEVGSSAVGDGGVWTGSLTSPGTPTLVSYVGNINGLGPQGLEIQHAPTLASTFAASPTYTETPGADSPNGTPIILSTSHNSTDADSGSAAVDQLAGAQVRISSGFQNGTERVDVLTINGTTSGTLDFGAQDISYSFNQALGVMTFTGVQTLDNYESVLALVRFRTDGDNPTNYGANTTRTISYSTFDGLLYSDETNVTVTVTGVNDAPINVVPGTQTFNEDTARVFSTANSNALSVSDVDANPAAQALQVTLSVAHGTLTLGSLTGLSFSAGDGTADTTMTFTGTANAINAALGTGGLTYNAIADYNGSDTLTFTVNDQGFSGTGGAQQDSDTVTLTINAVADIVNDSKTTNEDTAANVTVQANDTFENPAHSITAVTQGTHGTVTINDNGTAGNTTDDYLVYTPTADYNGSDSFTYTITSGGVTETATVSVTVSAVADIAADSVTVVEDTPTNLDLLANDSFENAGRAITAVGAATHGTASINNNGTAGNAADDYVVYTPNADYHGSDSFTYTVTSGGVTETATASVTVTAVADIADDNVTVNEDSGSNTLNLLANDSFEDSGRAITAVGAASHGSAVINNNGTPGNATDDFVTYTPTAGYNGSDSFTYTVTSGGGLTETATVNVTVNPVNDPPTSTNLAGDSVTWTEGDPAVLLDSGSNATVADIDSPDFGSGTLTVDITSGEVSSEDTVAIRNEGNAAGQIGVSGSNVAFGGTTIGTFAGGSAGSPLVVTFNASATTAAAQALLHNITYANTGGDNPTDGNRTVTWTLVDGDGTANGGVDTLTLTTTVNVDPVDDAPVAQPDAVSTPENLIGTGSVFANNGSGADADVDGPALSVAQVNGSAANVGTQITLGSGALLTVNADGTYSYDPNGKFNYEISSATALATGAVNDGTTEDFTYMLAGGNTVSVTVNVTGVDGPGDELRGNGGDNAITGTGAGDFINLSQGGSDSANGGLGNDAFYMGAALTPGDQLVGGGGFDEVGLQGNYGSSGSPVVLGPATFGDMDLLVLLPGDDARFGDTAGNHYSYYLTTDDGNVAAGQRLTVNWNTLRVGENVTFNGSAETDGSFLTFASKGDDHLTGGQQNDAFYFGFGNWGTGDSVDGQGGTMDEVGLQGNYAGANAIVFGATQLTGIELIACLPGSDSRFGVPPGSGYSYDLTMNDGNVAAGHTLYINANTLLAAGGTLTADETLTFNGSAETDGQFIVYSGAGADTITGGAGDDQIWGGGGADTVTGGLGADSLHGGAGNDLFVYAGTGESTSLGMDQILDFATGDQIDLHSIDADTTQGGLQGFSYIGSSAFSDTAGELQAVEQTPGHWLIQGDTDGNGSADLVIAVTTSDSHALTSADFVV